MVAHCDPESVNYPRAKMKSKSVALITGASSGVGIDFARELARRGYDLILTARRAERLAVVQNELRDAFGIRVETLTTDPDSRRH